MNDKIKIFIVEDEALIADEIRRALVGLGYEVSGICYKFDTAAAAIPTADADLFLLDINLSSGPGKDGIALAGLLKQVNPKPFIFLTAYSDQDTVRRATATHPANYLIKPVNQAMLFAALQLSIARAEAPATDLAAPEAPPDFFYVKLGSRTIRLQWQEVYAMEASKNYVRIFSAVHPGEYPIRGNIGFVLERLVPQALQGQFFRLGRSVCLNRAYVTSITEDTIVCGGRAFENGGRISSESLNL